MRLLSISYDPWVLFLPGFRPRPKVPGTSMNIIRMDELVTESEEWNRQLIQYLFDPRSVTAILKIPALQLQDDGSKKWLWALSSLGSFPVKSMYQKILFSQLGEPLHQDQLIWKAIWKANLHPRHKLL
ncbi:hypothetical protein TorRG33x02_209540 [Trema orientale]|uniref:Reverse transcriptase zinc-binding domain-containing protein n=1 Tax=Trema orientale TaxID=63057 RepID=A0A2P5ECL6_TREOI|nr:hypothetical protein TorRG33x02_209540 [Trema orientale]